MCQAPRWSSRQSATIPQSTRRQMSAAGFLSTCRRLRTTSGRAPAPGRGSNRANDRGMALLEVAGLGKRFGTVAAVDDVSLTIERGALLGPSGCGKTTLLRIIAGLDTPDCGRVVIDGVDVTALPPYARPVNMMF